jgi:uncharacterized membrane protein YfcA
MTIAVFTALVWLGSVAAGFIGALTGLGGGVVLVPLLVLVFGVNLRYAIGASLVSVIATSSGAAAAYVSEGYSNIRIAMFLEIATTAGALAGAAVAARTPARGIAVVFGIALLYSAYLLSRQHSDETVPSPSSRLAVALRMNGSYPSPEGTREYGVQHVPGGFAVMFGAGILSGLLGIGSGAVKVLAMDRIMRLPFKVSTTTSNFMIGVTAAASAGVYLHRGYIDPGLAFPVMLGVLTGATAGAHVLKSADVKYLRVVFVWVVIALGLEMLVSGVSGRLCC